MIQFTTERLNLCRISSDDFRALRQFECDDQVMRYTAVGRAQSPEESHIRLLNQVLISEKSAPYGIWLAQLLNDSSENGTVGWAMLRPTEAGELELGYMLVRQKWGQGFATEIARRLVEFALQQREPRPVIAKTSPENHPSMRVLEKVGFVFEESLQDSLRLFMLPPKS
jgi:RimJ/RimL family protein N-acetyltransferase